MATILPSTVITPSSSMSHPIKLLKLDTATQHTFRSKADHMKEDKLRCERNVGKISRGHRSCEFKVSAMLPSFVDKTGEYFDRSSKTEETERPSTYLFRTEFGGQVKVLVQRKHMEYVVHIEVSSLPQNINKHNLVLNWGMFRSDSSCWIDLDSQTSSLGGSHFTTESETNLMPNPYNQKFLGRHALDLVFDPHQAPFYLSFLVYSPSDVASGDIWIRTHRRTNFCVPVGIGSGYPTPLGVSFHNDGSVNFALFSRNAEKVVLCLYSEMTNTPSLELELDPYVNRTGDVWHVSMESVGKYASYGYRCKGSILSDKGDGFHMPRVLLDPYAKVIGSFISDKDDSKSLVKCLGRLCKEPTFDWNGDSRPCLPMEKLMVYRLNVGHFTEDKSSQLPENIAGTFSGLIEKLDHIKKLGVNAVLLEPVFAFDEKKGSYYPYAFFSPMSSYGPQGDCISASDSMKTMVKTLHANGIEVLLEVVFTHTAEGGDSTWETISFHGIDNSSYYIIDRNAESGAGNSLNCNNFIVQMMILDSLRHWVNDYHIDGFCFMNASSLLRGLNGELLSRAPLAEAIAFDPLLSKTKIIADYWSPVDMSCKEIQFPHWKRWAEINTRFSHDVRSFLRGEGLPSELATRLCGSGDIFSDGRGPGFSFNFIARNFGLTLVDLVSFSSGELSAELSWNCGEEGPTNKVAILERRLKQIRNFLFVLYISLGVPVLNMGDEYGQSAGGSPLYSDRSYFDWDRLRTQFGVQTTQFIAYLSSFRMRRSDLLQKRSFIKIQQLEWHGKDESQPNWKDPLCKFLAVTMKAEKDDRQSRSDWGDLFIAFNASSFSENVILPQLSDEMTWFRLVDTALLFPGFFSNDGDPIVQLTETTSPQSYEVKSHSCALFEARMSTM